jgi:NADH:ubiquinone oxidoreductase subunit B-like Fe-S oxidoreductase
LRRGAERNAADDGRGQRSQAQIVSTHARFPLRKKARGNEAPTRVWTKIVLVGTLGSAWFYAASRGCVAMNQHQSVRMKHETDRFGVVPFAAQNA